MNRELRGKPVRKVRSHRSTHHTNPLHRLSATERRQHTQNQNHRVHPLGSSNPTLLSPSRRLSRSRSRWKSTERRFVIKTKQDKITHSVVLLPIATPNRPGFLGVDLPNCTRCLTYVKSINKIHLTVQSPSEIHHLGSRHSQVFILSHKGQRIHSMRYPSHALIVCQVG